MFYFSGNKGFSPYFSSMQKLVCTGSEVTEEFVETDYYKDLNCIDKQHHTVLLRLIFFFYLMFSGSEQWNR